MVLNFISWNATPEIFQLGPLAIRWYGLLWALAFVASYIVMKRIFTREKLTVELLDKLTFYVFIATVLGARLGHCLFYQPDYYLQKPLEILFIWHGGLASHGAAVGIIIGLWLFARKEKHDFLWVFDRIAIVAPLAGAFIRLGNLMNSEIIGRQTDVAWAFIFQRLDAVPRHPTQLYEAIACLIIFAGLLHLYYRNNAGEKRGMLIGTLMVTLFTFRFFVEFLKENEVDFEEGMNLNMGQILSIPFVIAGLALLFWSFTRNKKNA